MPGQSKESIHRMDRNHVLDCELDLHTLTVSSLSCVSLVTRGQLEAVGLRQGWGCESMQPLVKCRNQFTRGQRAVTFHPSALICFASCPDSQQWPGNHTPRCCSCPSPLRIQDLSRKHTILSTRVPAFFYFLCPSPSLAPSPQTEASTCSCRRFSVGHGPRLLRHLSDHELVFLFGLILFCPAFCRSYPEQQSCYQGTRWFSSALASSPLEHTVKEIIGHNRHIITC